MATLSASRWRSPWTALRADDAYPVELAGRGPMDGDGMKTMARRQADLIETGQGFLTRAEEMALGAAKVGPLDFPQPLFRQALTAPVPGRPRPITDRVP